MKKSMKFDLDEIKRKLEEERPKRKMFVMDCSKFEVLHELEKFFEGYGFSD